MLLNFHLAVLLGSLYVIWQKQILIQNPEKILILFIVTFIYHVSQLSLSLAFAFVLHTKYKPEKVTNV